MWKTLLVNVYVMNSIVLHKKIQPTFAITSDVRLGLPRTLDH